MGETAQFQINETLKEVKKKMEKVLKIGGTLLVVLVILSSCIGMAGDERKEAYNDGYEAGYESGLRDGKALAREDGLAGGDIYYYNTIYDMDIKEIIAYLEEGEEYKVLSYDEIATLVSYSMQRGYIAGKTDTRDEALEEYIGGYDVTNVYDRIEEFLGYYDGKSSALSAWKTWAYSRR